MTPNALIQTSATLERAKTLLALARLAMPEDRPLVDELACQLMSERQANGRFGSYPETLLATLALAEAGAFDEPPGVALPTAE